MLSLRARFPPSALVSHIPTICRLGGKLAAANTAQKNRLQKMWVTRTDWVDLGVDIDLMAP